MISGNTRGWLAVSLGALRAPVLRMISGNTRGWLAVSFGALRAPALRMISGSTRGVVTGSWRVKSSTVVAATIASLLVLHMLPPLLRPADFFQDDSYFYMQIASNIVAGRGGTFHGITPTNGYHPLWMAGAVSAVFLSGGDKIGALYVVAVMQVLLAFGAALLFYRLSRAMGLESGLAGVAVLLTYLLGTTLLGSEAHLNALTLTAGSMSLWQALGSDRSWPWFRTGLLFGLAILARLDNLFVVAALTGLGIAYEHERGVSVIAKRAAAGALGGVLVLVPYLAFNATHFGHLMPISGAIKSTFPSFDFNVNRLGSMGQLATPFGVAALFIGQFLDDSRRRRVMWRGLGAGVIIHALYIAGLTDHYTFWSWYYVSAVLTAGLVTAYLTDWIGIRVSSSRVGPVLRSLPLMLAVAVLLAGAARSWLKAYNPIEVGSFRIDIPVNEYRWPEEFGRWMKEHMARDSAVFVFDWPGAIAYYSDLTIVPMDGLVNDFRYNDDLLAEGAQSYLCSRNLRFFFGLVDADAPVQHVAVKAPLYRRAAGSLTLHAEDIVARSRDVVSRPDEALPFAVWRLRCPADHSSE